MKEKWKLWRILVLCAGVLYLLVVVGATIYSQTAAVEKLPVVKLGAIENGVVPNAALVETDMGMLVNFVEQTDGPWGKRYLLRQISVSGYRAVDDTSTLLLDTSSITGPIAVEISTPDYYDGMEVRLG
jgi:hypothetical protein